MTTEVQPSPTANPAEWLHTCSRSGSPESLDLRRRLFAATANPTALRDNSVGLDRVGRVRSRWATGATAAEAFEEARATDRRRRETYGDRPQVVGDLVVCLRQVAGHATNKLGDADGAAARVEAAGPRTGEDER